MIPNVLQLMNVILRCEQNGRRVWNNRVSDQTEHDGETFWHEDIVVFTLLQMALDGV